jgi:tetratricopeptide (TPR) repeat protein
MRSSCFRSGFLVLVCLVQVIPIDAQEVKLAELRLDFAQRYLQPEAHFALAKYYVDHGNFLQAFFIIEYARKYRFEEKDFDKAYFAVFGDPMAEPPDEAKDAFEAATKLITEKKYDEAEAYFLKANKIYSKSFFINTWTGRFYNKVRNDSTKALPYYFKSYFLYPHAYETEYAEYRIRSISYPYAAESFNTALTSGKTLRELSHSDNPIVVGLAVGEMNKTCNADHVPALLDAMSNDDSLIRWGAFVTLKKCAGDSFRRIVSDMLVDPDLRKRGLAAYAIVEGDDDGRFRVLQKMLEDPAELIRFDVLSALILSGGARGRQMLKEHQSVEKQATLKTLIGTALQQVPK